MLERICIVGSGNWGSTISKIIGKNVLNMSGRFETDVRLWVHEELVNGRKLSEIINTDHENVKYLPGVKLPENVRAVTDLTEAASGASLLVFVLPHQFLAAALKTLKQANCVRADARGISLIKGLDACGNGIQLASEMIHDTLGIDVSVMMGANLANEIAQELFCESTIGCADRDNGQTFKDLVETDYFRISVSNDLLGVELCGALKNIVAVAAGIVDGLSMGDNTKAAVIRMGLDEMRRFCKLFAGSSVQDETFFESCGVADLITSCIGGRNRKVGEALVKTKKSVDELEKELLGGQKLQGPPTAKEVHTFLKQKEATSLFPLMTLVHQVCYEGLPADRFIAKLQSTHRSKL